MTMAPDQYWAVGPDQDMPASIVEKFKGYYDLLVSRGRAKKWRAACSLYFGRDAKGGYTTSHEVTFGGKQGETVETNSNHFRSLIRRMHTMITEQRPEFEVSTVNDSGDSLAHQTLGSMLLDFYMDEGKIEYAARGACERALVVSEAYVHQYWDVDRGDILMKDPNTGVPLRSGDICTEAVSPWDVAFDLDMPPGDEPNWVIVRRYHNRWDLMAKYPVLREELLNFSINTQVDRGVWEETEPRKGSSDWLPCLIFYHERTPAVPDGRMLLTCGDWVLFSGPLPYDSIPVYKIRPSDEFDTNLGYSDSWDVMGMQAIYNSVLHSMFSTQDAFGMPNIIVDKQAKMDVRRLAGGLKKVEFDSKGGTISPPEAMKLPQIPETAFRLRELIKDDMEINFGINAVARGEALEEATSGSHAALIQSMAIQYASGLVYSYIKLLRRLGYGAIRLLQTFATEPRAVAIAGPDNEPLFRSFTNADLSQVRQVRVEMGSAQMRTFQQKKEIASELIERFEGQITVEQYLTFLSTGRVEPLYKHQKSEVLNIRRENERLAKGQPTKVLVLDHHMLHIREHSCLLHNPDIRFDDAKSLPITMHIQEHIRQLTILQMTNPALLIATGQFVPEAPLPPQMDPNEGALGKPAKPQKSDGGEEKGPPSAKAAVPGVPDASNLPNMPRNPGTGEPASPDGG